MYGKKPRNKSKKAAIRTARQNKAKNRAFEFAQMADFVQFSKPAKKGGKA